MNSLLDCRDNRVIGPEALADDESQEKSAVDILDRGGVAQKTCATEHVCHVANPDAVGCGDLQAADEVGENIITPLGSLELRSDRHQPQAILEAQLLKTVFSPPLKHWLMHFVLAQIAI